jgi:hypothetical protein
VLQKQDYNPQLIGKDEYGKDYDITEPNLAGFADRLKTTKKRRFTNTEGGPTYGDLVKQ